MPVPLFITTNWTPLLEQALEARTPAKKPTTMYFPWNKRADWPDSPAPSSPTKETPLVYHLFGRMDDPDSLVLTEDDYFEWLRAWVAKQDLVPGVVRKQLTNRSLMFLGYYLDDWEFRVVFQCIKAFESSDELLRNNVHVGVQFSPGAHDVEPEAAQDYIESYFDSDACTGPKPGSSSMSTVTAPGWRHDCNGHNRVAGSTAQPVPRAARVPPRRSAPQPATRGTRARRSACRGPRRVATRSVGRGQDLAHRGSCRARAEHGGIRSHASAARQSAGAG